MSTPNCHQCGQPLPDSADLSRRCAACGAWNIARGGAAPSSGAGARAPRKPVLGALWQRVVGALVLLVLVGLVGGGVALYRMLRSDVQLYVDNGGANALEVRIDGKPRGQVPAASHVRIDCRSGDRLIEVIDGGAVVYSGRHTLQAPPKSDRPSKYLLNPGKATRYHTYQIEYGFALPMPNWGGFGMAWGEEDARRRKYHQIAEKVTLFPASEWADVSQFDHVLEPAPAEVQGNLRETRRVLLRVPTADYELIAGARKNNKPTQAEVEELERVVAPLLQRP